MSTTITRRQFIQGVSALGVAGASLGLLSGCGSRSAVPAAMDAPLETTRLRLSLPESLCQASMLVADELLPSEGFADVQWILEGGSRLAPVIAGEADITMRFGGPLLMRIDAGDPLVILAGGHLGCLELFGSDRVRTITDLRGRTVGINGLGNPWHVSTAMLAAYVGLDPQKDIDWVVRSGPELLRGFADGQLDAVMVSPPFSQELRAQQIGHVLVNTALDRPWSQYFCCMIVGHRDFVQKHPVATKRALRAILKAADHCTLEPERAARSIVDRGFGARYDYALQTMTELPYGQWREYDAEDALRFYALRLHEVGMVKNTPEKLIAQGTDWRFLNELKRELKA